MVLGGEALQLGAQGLLLLRDDAEGARLGVMRGCEVSPAPYPLQVWGRGLWGRAELPHTHPRACNGMGMGCVPPRLPVAD